MQRNVVTEVKAQGNDEGPSFGEALQTWTRIGVLSFGGPTAQIALMHKIIVDEKKWLNEQEYLNALSFCMLLPGAAVVLALSMIYAAFGNVPAIEAVFFGIKAAVLVIVVEALLRISRRALVSTTHWVIAAVSFVAIFLLGLPFPLIIAVAAAIGFLQAGTEESSVAATRPSVALMGTLSTIGWGLAIWILPLAALAAVVGRDHVLTQLSWFFSKLAMVTFGGAYAVLAYMAQDVVVRHGWLEAGQMMDGLGLAETTPGPLILVTEFVGYLAAYRHGGDPVLVMGLLGAFVALWATFVPCFLWIFAGAPYIEWIIARPRLRGALSAITAAVVGVILNLAVWFALHVFFGKVTLIETGGLKFWTPDLTTLDWRVVLLALVSGLLLLRWHWGIASVLGVAATLAVGLRLAGI